MTNSILTKDLLTKLGIDEFKLRNAIRAGHIEADKLSNGMYVWNPDQVKAARKFFRSRK